METFNANNVSKVAHCSWSIWGIPNRSTNVSTKKMLQLNVWAMCLLDCHVLMIAINVALDSSWQMSKLITESQKDVWVKILSIYLFAVCTLKIMEFISVGMAYVILRLLRYPLVLQKILWHALRMIWFSMWMPKNANILKDLV